MKHLLLFVSLVVLAGCAGIVPGGTDSGPPEGVGEVGNVSYDAQLDIDASDGLTEAELDPFVNRTMARIEVVRELDFERPVEVTVVNRTEYRSEYADRVTGPTRPAWENQIWRAMFIVGQDRNVTTVLEEAFGGSVQGFYEPGQDNIVIVSNSESARINERTLVHELTHALQDQAFRLTFGADTRDQQAAYDTLIEGEANLVSALYRDRCSEWSCLESEVGNSSLEPGIAEIILQPYTQGPRFVERLRADGGWEAVNEAHEEPPLSTAQTIYPDRYSADRPRNLTIADRSSADWERFDQHPVGDTLGVVSIYAMFVTNDVIQPDQQGSYAHPVTEGWRGDRIVPYRNGDSFGYVWELVWASSDDAEQFADAYRDLLDQHGGKERGIDRFRIADGPYAGAYQLTVDGETVQIVNAPSRRSLSAVHDS